MCMAKTSLWQRSQQTTWHQTDLVAVFAAAIRQLQKHQKVLARLTLHAAVFVYERATHYHNIQSTLWALKFSFPQYQTGLFKHCTKSSHVQTAHASSLEHNSAMPTSHARHADEQSGKKLTWNLQAARSACPYSCASLWQTASTVVTTPPQSSCLLLVLVPNFKCCVKTYTCCRHTEQHQVHMYSSQGSTILYVVPCIQVHSSGPELIPHILKSMQLTQRSYNTCFRLAVIKRSINHWNMQVHCCNLPLESCLSMADRQTGRESVQSAGSGNSVRQHTPDATRVTASLFERLVTRSMAQHVDETS